MRPHEDSLPLRQMLEYAGEAHALIQGKHREDLESNHVLELALTRLLEIIGEAANRVTDETRAEYPQIPWRQMVGLRNRLIDGYDAVDLDILWDVIEWDLPKLIDVLRTIVHGTSPDI